MAFLLPLDQGALHEGRERAGSRQVTIYGETTGDPESARGIELMPLPIDDLPHLSRAEHAQSAEAVGLGRDNVFQQALGDAGQRDTSGETSSPARPKVGWNSLPAELRGQVALRVAQLPDQTEARETTNSLRATSPEDQASVEADPRVRETFRALNRFGDTRDDALRGYAHELEAERNRTWPASTGDRQLSPEDAKKQSIIDHREISKAIRAYAPREQSTINEMLRDKAKEDFQRGMTAPDAVKATGFDPNELKGAPSYEDIHEQLGRQLGEQLSPEEETALETMNNEGNEDIADYLY